MSVINQMLRDLEARRARTEKTRHYIDEVNIIARKPSVRYGWLALGLLVLIVSIAIFWFLNDSQSPTIVAQSEVIDLPVNRPVKKAVINITEKVSTDAIKKTPSVPDSEAKPESRSETSKVTVASVSDNKSRNIMDANPVKEDSTLLNRNMADSVVKKKSIVKTVNSRKTINNKEKSKTDFRHKAKINKIERINKKATEDRRTQIITQARTIMASDIHSAVKLLEKNLDNVKVDVDYYSLLANLYQRQQRYDDAIVIYRKALAIKPQNGELWIGIALAYKSNGEIENEQQAFQRAVKSTNIRPELRQYAVQQLKK